MKQKFVLALGLGVIALAGCTSPEDSSGGGVTGQTITAEAKTFEGFNAQYNPVNDKIYRQSGRIKICLDEFSNTEFKSAWQAVVDEYKRLHDYAPEIVLETATGEYDTYILNQRDSLNIVQGNLLRVDNLGTYCYSFTSDINKENPYAGLDRRGNVNYWDNVLTPEAYDASSGGSTAYILNTENLQTAWFVNKNAMAEAANNGYEVVDADGNPAMPRDWDELISLCDGMQKAGYNHPLGVALNNESISADQFSWILRVYGDEYYRNEYKHFIVNENFEYDPTDPDLEKSVFFTYTGNETAFFNSVLDTRTGEDRPFIYPTEKKTEYVGALSEKYGEFITQLAKMKPYLSTDSDTQGLVDARNYFAFQTRGKDSPQIVLDYAGEGLFYAKQDKISYDYFDYPAMTSEGGYIDDGTIVRDVGGTGGFLSILKDGKSDAAVNLSLDFLKYFASPYGQTVYYDALSKTSYAPRGITTIKNEYVCIPAEWQSFFNSDKISFNGLVDNNPYIQSFIRGLGGSTIPEAKSGIQTTMRNLLTKNVSVNDTQIAWDGVMNTAWQIYCDKYNWNRNCYKHPGYSVTDDLG